MTFGNFKHYFADTLMCHYKLLLGKTQTNKQTKPYVTELRQQSMQVYLSLFVRGLLASHIYDWIVHA